MVTCYKVISGTEYACGIAGCERPRMYHYGKSTDTKPTEGVNNADVFCEMDTGAVYLFDQDGQTWLPF